MTNEIKSLTDDQLVALFRKGSSEAFGILLDRYNTTLHTYIRFHVGAGSVAEDIFQDTFMKVIAKIRAGSYSYQGKFKSWILRIAHNQLVDYFRHKKVMNLISLEDSDDSQLFVESLPSPQPNIDDIICRENVRDEIRGWVGQLSDEQREIIELRFKEDMSFKEIARHTGVSINTALGRMRYALMNLRKMEAVARYQP